MQQNKESRNKPTPKWPINIWQADENIQWRKDNIFNKWCQKNWTATSKRIKLGYCLTSHTKVNSKWSKGLNVRLETIKLLEENTGNTLVDINLRNTSLSVSLGKGDKSKNKQMELHQTKKLFHSEGNYQQNEKTGCWMEEEIYKQYTQ